MLGLLTMLVGGCGTPQPPEQPNPPPAPLMATPKPAVKDVDVDLAIQVALALRSTPAEHQAILHQHGLTPDSWEAAVVDIASDPQASERYAAGLEAQTAEPEQGQEEPEPTL